MINNFLYQKNNYILSSFAIILMIIFVSLDRFSFFSVTVGVLNLVFIYLYQFKNNKELLSYGLVFVSSFISIYLYQADTINQSLSVIFIAIFSTLFYYVLFFSKDCELNIGYLYSAITLFLIIQLSNIIVLIQSGIPAKALFITLIFYLVSGIIKLYLENKLNFNYVVKYSIVFSIGIIIVTLNLNYLV